MSESVQFGLFTLASVDLMHFSAPIPSTEYGSCTELDARGLSCPLPLLKAKQQLRNLASGEMLKVLATDQGSVRDFKAYADISGHRLIDQQEDQGVYIHWLQKV